VSLDYDAKAREVMSYSDALALGRKAAENGDSREWVAQFGIVALSAFDEMYDTVLDPQWSPPDKFTSPAPLPTPYEKELLTNLMEEAFEILTFLGPRASKAIRFGLDEIQPGQELTNAQRLTQEIGDLCAVVDRLTKCGALSMAEIIAAKERKFPKLDRFMQSRIGDR